MVNSDAELTIMQTLKDKDLDCFKFNNFGVVWAQPLDNKRGKKLLE